MVFYLIVSISFLMPSHVFAGRPVKVYQVGPGGNLTPKETQPRKVASHTEIIIDDFENVVMHSSFFSFGVLAKEYIALFQTLFSMFLKMLQIALCDA